MSKPDWPPDSLSTLGAWIVDDPATLETRRLSPDELNSVRQAMGPGWPLLGRMVYGVAMCWQEREEAAARERILLGALATMTDRAEAAEQQERLLREALENIARFVIGPDRYRLAHAVGLATWWWAVTDPGCRLARRPRIPDCPCPLRHGRS